MSEAANQDVFPGSLQLSVDTPVVGAAEHLESLNHEKIHKVGFQLFVVERPANDVNMGVYLFALDWSKGRGFFYWTYKS